MAIGFWGKAGLRALLTAGVVLSLGGLACAQPPLPLGGFQDAIHHWQMKGGEDYPRHDPADIAAIADNLLLLQRDHGGWVQNRDPLRVLRPAEVDALMAEKAEPRGSFDNRNVYTQIEYLMGAYDRLGDARYLEGARRGLGYLIANQMQGCGGWPHTVPPQSYYQGRITVADEVFSGPLALLRSIAEARAPMNGFGAETQAQAAAALERGEACLLKLQVRQGETLTGWAGQYDPATLQPMGGRSFELPGIVSEETVAILRYLMSIEAPSPEIIASVKGGAEWLARVKIEGVRLETVKLDQSAEYRFHDADFDRRLVEDAGAPPLWARFYDLDDNSVVLANRDGIRVERYDQVDPERRTGYSWYGTWPSRLVAKEYPHWHCRVLSSPVEGGACK
jgi:PelA/Pel-15E family pectate lyase